MSAYDDAPPSRGLLTLGQKASLRASATPSGNEGAPVVRRDEDVDGVSRAVDSLGFLGGGLLLMSLWSKHPVWGFVLGSMLGSHAATLVNAGIASAKDGGAGADAASHRSPR